MRDGSTSSTPGVFARGKGGLDLLVPHVAQPRLRAPPPCTATRWTSSTAWRMPAIIRRRVSSGSATSSRCATAAAATALSMSAKIPLPSATEGRRAEPLPSPLPAPGSSAPRSAAMSGLFSTCSTICRMSSAARHSLLPFALPRSAPDSTTVPPWSIGPRWPPPACPSADHRSASSSGRSCPASAAPAAPGRRPPCPAPPGTPRARRPSGRTPPPAASCAPSTLSLRFVATTVPRTRARFIPRPPRRRSSGRSAPRPSRWRPRSR